jgi:hypothetical protein
LSTYFDKITDGTTSTATGSSIFTSFVSSLTIIFPEENVIEFIEDYSGRTQNVFTSGTITIPKNVGFKIRGGKLRLGGM